MAEERVLPGALTPAQIEQFIADGYVKVDDAFPRVVADAARAILWKDTGCDPDDPSQCRWDYWRVGVVAGAVAGEVGGVGAAGRAAGPGMSACVNRGSSSSRMAR